MSRFKLHGSMSLYAIVIFTGLLRAGSITGQYGATFSHKISPWFWLHLAQDIMVAFVWLFYCICLFIVFVFYCICLLFYCVCLSYYVCIFYRVCPSMFFSMLGLFSILALSLFLQAKIEGTYSRGPLLGRESMWSIPFSWMIRIIQLKLTAFQPLFPPAQYFPV